MPSSSLPWRLGLLAPTESKQRIGSRIFTTSLPRASLYAERLLASSQFSVDASRVPTCFELFLQPASKEQKWALLANALPHTHSPLIARTPRRALTPPSFPTGVGAVRTERPLASASQACLLTSMVAWLCSFAV